MAIPSGELQKLLSQLDRGTKPPKSPKPRVKLEPRRGLLIAAAPLLLAGIGWSVYSALSAAPQDAPIELQPNATVIEGNTPAPAPPPRVASTPIVKTQARSDEWDQVRFLFHNDKGTNVERKFKMIYDTKFRGPEAYIVKFNAPMKSFDWERFKSEGIVLVENYGRTVSVFWIPSETALKRMDIVSLVLCPLYLDSYPAEPINDAPKSSKTTPPRPPPQAEPAK